jgi:hypothetical protein
VTAAGVRSVLTSELVRYLRTPASKSSAPQNQSLGAPPPPLPPWGIVVVGVGWETVRFAVLLVVLPTEFVTTTL